MVVVVDKVEEGFLYMSKIKIVDTNTMPICPYCEKELETVERAYTGMLNSNVIYICPHCKKLLSIGINR